MLSTKEVNGMIKQLQFLITSNIVSISYFFCFEGYPTECLNQFLHTFSTNLCLRCVAAVGQALF